MKTLTLISFFALKSNKHIGIIKYVNLTAHTTYIPLLNEACIHSGRIYHWHQIT